MTTTFKGHRREIRRGNQKPETSTVTTQTVTTKTWKHHAARVAGSPSSFLRALTSRWLGVFWLSLMMVYFTLVSVENYWLALSPLRLFPFMPKLFVNDGANLAILQAAWSQPVFWLAVALCLAVQAIEANYLRASNPKSTALAKREKAAKTEFRKTHNKAKGSWMLLAIAAYAVDIWSAWQQFPLMGTEKLSIFVCWFWFACSIFAPELIGNAILHLMENPEDDD